MTRLAVKEDEWVAAVGDILDHHGWRWYESHPTRRSVRRWTPEGAARGIPDLICMRPPRLVFVELKTETGRVTEEQAAWIEGLRQSDAEVYVVRLPGDYPFLDDLLRPDSEQMTLTSNSTSADWLPQTKGIEP